MADVSHESMMEYYHIANKMFNSEDEGYTFYNNMVLRKVLVSGEAMSSGMDPTAI